MISIVVPLFNEEDSVEPLVRDVRSAMADWNEDWELLLVDDGSVDRTWPAMEGARDRDGHVRLVRLARNYGQTAAMQAGFDHARGTVVVTMDGDLQNDPVDIPALVSKLGEGYDLVAGYRVRRADPWLTRRLPSSMGNALARFATGIPIRDTGCTLKAFRREVLSSLRLYSDLHRFIPALAARVAGARIAEIPVRHRPRRFGTSKYGLTRVWKVVADLAALAMLRRFEEQPLRMFATTGMIALIFAFTSSLGAVAAGADLFDASMVVLAVIAMNWLALGGFLIMAGLVAESFVHVEKDDQRFHTALLRRVSR